MEDEWNGKDKFWKFLVAGAVAGTAEHCGMFPIDTIKTHMQALHVRHHAAAPISALRTAQLIYGKSGVLGFFRGVTAVALGAAPAHAIYFTTYEVAKRQIVGNREGHHPFRTAFAGCFATMVSDGVMTPMDAVKQRMQLHLKPYKTATDCVRTVWVKEGPLALYAGYTTTLAMNVPFNGIYFAVYESSCLFLKRYFQSNDYDPRVHCIGGGAAGIVASGLTNPFDVARTRLQTGGDVGRVYNGMLHAFRTIWIEEGWRGYVRGVGPRMSFHAMSASVCWTVYEYIKHALDMQ